MNASRSSEGNKVILDEALSDGDIETRSKVSQKPQSVAELDRLSAEEKKICLSRN